MATGDGPAGLRRHEADLHDPHLEHGHSSEPDLNGDRHGPAGLPLNGSHVVDPPQGRYWQPTCRDCIFDAEKAIAANPQVTFIMTHGFWLMNEDDTLKVPGTLSDGCPARQEGPDTMAEPALEAGVLSDSSHVVPAASLSLASHQQLRAGLPFLPERARNEFASRIEWMVREGVLVGLFAEGKLAAYLGAFPIDHFRNAGAGAFGPDWCHGFAPDVDPAHAWPRLYRELAPRLIERGCRIHCFALYSAETAALQAMHLTGFGRIVMDAARPTSELADELRGQAAGLDITRAVPGDAPRLADLESKLAAHIAAPPVLMPNAGGRSAAAWEEWLASAEHVATRHRRAKRWCPWTARPPTRRPAPSGPGGSVPCRGVWSDASEERAARQPPHVKAALPAQASDAPRYQAPVRLR